jgi:D-serine deaminase-like pyridoxal phosphate-dependent protein
LNPATAIPAWPMLTDPDGIPSPALVLDLDRVERNLGWMLSIAGGADRLRPHLKTHKLGECVAMQVAAGVVKAKVATVAEAEMAALHGVRDVLLAVQPVGPQAWRLGRLACRFPGVTFSAVVDDFDALDGLVGALRGLGLPRMGVWVDLDVGQHRTGIEPGAGAERLVERILEEGKLEFRGLHAYDGHLGIGDREERERACEEAFGPVTALRERLEKRGIGVPTVVAGGSPTFAMHARRPGVELSPGTTLLWDAGYGQKLKDLPFEPAAFLLARVISRPGKDCICLDLGHKAVGSEMPHPRVIFPELGEVEVLGHSEEHLVLRTERAIGMRVGTVVMGIPWHICPTMALHQEVWVMREGEVKGRWAVEARARRLTE